MLFTLLQVTICREGQYILVSQWLAWRKKNLIPLRVTSATNSLKYSHSILLWSMRTHCSYSVSIFERQTALEPEYTCILELSLCPGNWTISLTCWGASTTGTADAASKTSGRFHLTFSSEININYFYLHIQSIFLIQSYYITAWDPCTYCKLQKSIHHHLTPRCTLQVSHTNSNQTCFISSLHELYSQLDCPVNLSTELY